VRRIPLISLGAAVLLAGCGEGDSEPPEPTTISVAAPATTTAPADESTAPVPPDDSAGDPAAADDPGADRPRTVEDVVTAVLTGSETPEVICDLLVTPAYVQEAYGDRSGCIAAQRPGSLAESIEGTFPNQSEGETASAVVIPTGGPYDGIEVQVELVAATDLEGAWLVDSLVADVPAGP
jgi:hypothetical protein